MHFFSAIMINKFRYKKPPQKQRDNVKNVTKSDNFKNVIKTSDNVKSLTKVCDKVKVVDAKVVSSKNNDQISALLCAKASCKVTTVKTNGVSKEKIVATLEETNDGVGDKEVVQVLDVESKKKIRVSLPG